MLVILAYYQVKAASRSLLLEYGGTQSFPYVWIGSAAVLLMFIAVYNRLVAHFSRAQVVTGSLVACAALLCMFWALLGNATITRTVIFYIFIDIMSVVLVEQFWSLSNTVTREDDGKKSYWFVATGGIVGGIAGGVIASSLIQYTPLQTIDLLLSCAAILLLTAAVTFYIRKRGLFEELPAQECMSLKGEGLRALVSSRYLLLIAVIICFSQLAEPIVEYQFLHAVSEHYAERDARTQFISQFFSLMGVVSVTINLVVTPLVHRKLGVIAGLLVQPLSLTVASVGYLANATLNNAVIMKICDRGMSYSINRASKELLYIPVDPVNTYQTKAWIDMLGYRLFKVLGSGMILLATQWSVLAASPAELSWLSFGVCSAWIFAIWLLAAEYKVINVPARA